MSALLCTECGAPAIGLPICEVLIKNENPQVYPPVFAWNPILFNLPRCEAHKITSAEAFLALPDMREEIKIQCEDQNVEVSERWRIRLMWIKPEAAQRLTDKAEIKFTNEVPEGI